MRAEIRHRIDISRKRNPRRGNRRWNAQALDLLERVIDRLVRLDELRAAEREQVKA